jgi:hypothetical protein
MLGILNAPAVEEEKTAEKAPEVNS